MYSVPVTSRNWGGHFAAGVNRRYQGARIRPSEAEPRQRLGHALPQCGRLHGVGSPDFEYLWLLHREPELDAGTREAFLQHARSLGYRLDDLVHTPHTARRTA